MRFSIEWRNFRFSRNACTRPNRHSRSACHLWDIMPYFGHVNKILASFCVLICGMAACGGPPRSPTAATASAAKARADLFQMPPELSGRNPVEQGLGYIDVVNELQAESSNSEERHFRVKTGSVFSARGWAFDDKRKIAPAVWLELISKSGGDRIFLSTKRTPSKDLAEGFRYPWAGTARFTALVEQANIPPGTYEATLYQADPDLLIKTPFYSVKRITITVE
jgi:hypothetical protein